MKLFKTFEKFNENDTVAFFTNAANDHLGLVYSILEKQGYQYVENESDNIGTFSYLKDVDFKHELEKSDTFEKRKIYKGIIFNTVFGKFIYAILLNAKVNEIDSYALYTPQIDNNYKQTEEIELHALNPRYINPTVLFTQLFRIISEYPAIIEFRKIFDNQNGQAEFTIFLTSRNTIKCKLLYERREYFGFDKKIPYVSEWGESIVYDDVLEGMAIIHNAPSVIIDHIKQTKGDLKTRVAQIKAVMPKYRGAIKMKKFGF